MRNRAQSILLVATAVVFFAGIAELMRLRFSRGDVYPVYSTYRADPLGTRALYESLRLLPGVDAQRWLRETEKIPRNFRGTLIFAGMERDDWERMPASAAARLDELANGGARIVVAFTAGFMERRLKQRRASRSGGGNTYDASAEPPGQAERADAGQERVDAGGQWGVGLNLYRIRPGRDGLFPGAERAAGADAAWPAQVEWMSEYFFEIEPGAGWRVLYTRQGRPVFIERRVGKGSLVLAADSFFMSNEALQRARATPVLAWLAGAPGGGGAVLIDEFHLGMSENTGLAMLARRYGLGGAACMAAVFAALWAWRRMALFVPPAPEPPAQVATGCDPAAGLEALLRRSIPRPQLARACLDEWRKSAGTRDAARADAVFSAPAGRATPEAAYNALLNALKKR